MSVLTLFICLTFSPVYSRYFVYSKPPFATLSPPRLKVSLYVYRPHCPLIFRLSSLACARVSSLSFLSMCFFIFLLHCRNVARLLFLFFSLFRGSSTPNSSPVPSHPFSFFLFLVLPPRAFSSSLAFSQSLRTYARQSMCARLSRAEAVEMAGSCQ